MKFEKLNVGDSYGKKMFLYGILVSFFLIILISIFTSRAKYRLTESVKIVDSVVSYSPYDFKIMEIYKQKDDSKCTDINGECYEKLNDTERMPSDGYVLNETNSHCDLSNDSKDNEAKLTSNESGEIVISGLTVKDKCYLYYDKGKSLSSQVLENLEFTSKGEVSNFNGTACSSGCTFNENGIYEIEDDFGTSYYFRGTVDNNWVQFGNIGGTIGSGDPIYWRIIRINGDGTIRLIYSGKKVPNVTGANTRISASTYNANGDYRYVGFEYGTGIHGKGSRSTALSQLNSWFQTNLNDEFTNGSGMIDPNVGFCNDRSVPSTGTWSEDMEEREESNPSSVIYGAHYRLPNGNPSLQCSTKTNRNNDYSTYINATGIKSLNSGTITGTQSLNYPVGLITADEVAFAGGAYNTGNSKYWLYTNQVFWTMSPSSYNGKTYVFYVNAYGTIYNNFDVSQSYGIRPVINLKSNTNLIAQNDSSYAKGTWQNPYTVSN